jgi:hypothetical protein
MDFWADALQLQGYRSCAAEAAPHSRVESLARMLLSRRGSAPSQPTAYRGRAHEGKGSAGPGWAAKKAE